MFVVLFLLAGVFAEEMNPRNGRWFLPRKTVTRVVYEKRPMTACVELEPSIKPCKYVRQLQVEPTPSFKLLRTSFPELPELDTPILSNTFLSGSKKETLERNDRDSWASYFGLEEVTETHTRFEEVPSSAARSLVRFSVRGCQPSRLPFDLSLCPKKTKHQN